MLGLAKHARRARQGRRRSCALETSDRRGARDPGGVGRRHQGQQPLVPRRLRAPRRRASTGRRISRPPGSARPAQFVVWQPGAVTGISALAASEPLDTWKDYLTFHAIQSHGAVLPCRLRRRALRVLRSGAERRQEAARPLEAGASPPPTDALGVAVGKLYVERYFPPAEKARAEGDGDQSRRRVPRPDRSPRMDGAGHEEGGQGQARRAQGGRRLSGQLARLRRPRRGEGRRLRQRGAGPAVPVPAEPCEARRAGGPRRVGDDAADRERGEPAGDERHEFPRRDPAAALLRSQASRWPWTTAPSARSSATR